MGSPEEVSAGALVFVGVATYDAIALVDGFPERDDRVIAENVVFAGGGPAATAAVAAARLGKPASFVGAVGDDEDGARIVSGLVAEGVDVSGVVVMPGRRSGVSVIIVDRLGGTRAICTRPAPPLVLPPDSVGAKAVQAAEWVHVDHVGWPVLQAVLNSQSATRPMRPRISVDAGNVIPDFSPRGVDLYVPTAAALERIYGHFDIDTLLEAAVTDGAGTVVATRGALGSAAVGSDGARHDAPGERAPVVSTLGAGDVFHGALLAAISDGTPLGTALSYANTVAALSCRGLDGRSAIPRRGDVDHLAKDFDR